MAGQVVSPYTVQQQIGGDIEAPQLSKEQKFRLAQEAIPFNITKAESGKQGDFGEFWVFTCRTGEYTFRFNMSDPISVQGETTRATAMEAEYNAIKSVTDNGDEVGPYILHYIEWSGNNFYKLEPAGFPIAELPQVQQEALPF